MHGKTNDEMLGRDAVSAIELNQGDILDAGVIPSSGQLSLYELEDCARSPENACVHGAVNTQTLSFYAPETKTYYLVVDTVTSTATPSFTLRVDVEPYVGLCQPGG